MEDWHNKINANWLNLSAEAIKVFGGDKLTREEISWYGSPQVRGFRDGYFIDRYGVDPDITDVDPLHVPGVLRAQGRHILDDEVSWGYYVDNFDSELVQEVDKWAKGRDGKVTIPENNKLVTDMEYAYSGYGGKLRKSLMSIFVDPTNADHMVRVEDFISSFDFTLVGGRPLSDFTKFDGNDARNILTEAPYQRTHPDVVRGNVDFEGWRKHIIGDEYRFSPKTFEANAVGHNILDIYSSIGRVIPDKLQDEIQDNCTGQVQGLLNEHRLDVSRAKIMERLAKSKSFGGRDNLDNVVEL